MNLTKYLALIGLSLCMSMAWANTANASRLDKIKASGVLNCGVMTNLSPFGMLKPKTGELQGYDIDYCKAVAAEMGVKPKITGITLAARIPMLAQGRVDIVVGVLGYNKQRAKKIDYTQQYFVSYQVVAVNEDSPVQKLKDLAGKRVSTIKGSSTPLLLKKKIPSAQMVSYDNGPAAFLALRQNKVDAIAMSETMISLFKSKLDNPDSVRVVEPFAREIWGLGIQEGNDELRHAVNQALTAIEKSGKAERIFNKWLGSDSIYDMTMQFDIKPIPGYKVD